MHHGRTSSGTRAGFVHTHLRANSASALLPSEMHLVSQNSVPTSSTDVPLDLSNGGTIPSQSPSKTSTTFSQSSSCHEEIFADDFASSTAAAGAKGMFAGGLNSSGYTRPILIPSRYDLAFTDNGNILSKMSNTFTNRSDDATVVSASPAVTVEKPSEEQNSAEEVWDVWISLGCKC